MANLNRGLIVSCQAVKGEPLYGLDMMHHFARAAVLGGAKGIRANYVSDIKAIKNEVDVPVIGIIKAVYEGSDVYITPTLKEVKELLTTGCEDEMGFDYVGSTMRGYTEYTKGISIPDYDMLAKMRRELNAKVIAEGGIWEISQLDKVLECDPYAVVIGSAITRPMDITKRFAKEFEK